MRRRRAGLLVRRRAAPSLAGSRDACGPGDATREVAVTIAATGVAMLVFSLASLTSTERTAEDRSSVRAGAVVVHKSPRRGASTPTSRDRSPEPKDGTPILPKDIPVARNPVLPAGQQRDVADPDDDRDDQRELSSCSSSTPRPSPPPPTGAATGGPVAPARALLPGSPAATPRRPPRPAATASAHSRAGHPRRVRRRPRAGVGSTLAVDTLYLTVRMAVRQIAAAFPACGTGRRSSCRRTRSSPPSSTRTPASGPACAPPASGRSSSRATCGRARLEAAAATLTTHGLRRTSSPPSPRPARRRSTWPPSRHAATRWPSARSSALWGWRRWRSARSGWRGGRPPPTGCWRGRARGGRATARARVVETAVVLVLSTALGVLALALVRPAGRPPRPRRRPRTAGRLVLPAVAPCSPRRLAAWRPAPARPWRWRLPRRRARRWRCSVARTTTSRRPRPVAATCSGLVRIYPTATGETHALRGVDAEFHGAHRHRADRALGQRQVDPARAPRAARPAERRRGDDPRPAAVVDAHR